VSPSRWLGLASLLAACAPAVRYEPPASLRAYDIVVTRDDSLGRELVRELERRGFRVRTRVRGGSGPTAYLFVFCFPAPGPEAVPWLHVRLADTRSGTVVAAVSGPRAALGATAAAQARAIADSLHTIAARGPLPPPPAPP
jgi:hypothetical protein